MSTYVPTKHQRQGAEDAGHRCGYRLSDETLTGIPLTIEHIKPHASGGETIRENLWLSCRPCNEFKGVQTEGRDPETGEIVPLFNPRTQSWAEHFAWIENGTQIIGITPTGRVTVNALQMNRPLLIYARRRWVLAGWHPPAISS